MLADQASRHAEMRIIVLHYDHGLQVESAEWVEFCKDLCECYGFDFFTNTSGVEIDKKIGLEASARFARYQWFGKAMKQVLGDSSVQNGLLLTAHHCDDQAETMLLNMIRGTGLKGLRGIAAKKYLSEKGDENQTVLLRPLLNFSKKSLQQFAELKQLKWIEDPSNQNTEFRRNAIRHQVMPALNEIKADVSKQFSKLSHRIIDAEQILQELAYSDLTLTQQYDFSPFDHSYGLVLEGLRIFSVPRQLNAIRYWLDLIRFPAESEIDLLTVLDWSLNGANSGAELRRGKRCYRYYQDTLYVMPYIVDSEGVYMNVGVSANIAWQDSSEPLSLSGHFSSDLSWQLHCSEESQFYGKPLKLKTLNDIDSIRLAKGEGHVQAKNCFQAAKVPTWRRKQSLFVTQSDDRFVAMVAGQKQDNFYLKCVNIDK